MAPCCWCCRGWDGEQAGDDSSNQALQSARDVTAGRDLFAGCHTRKSRSCFAYQVKGGRDLFVYRLSHEGQLVYIPCHTRERHVVYRPCQKGESCWFEAVLNEGEIYCLMAVSDEAETRLSVHHFIP